MGKFSPSIPAPTPPPPLPTPEDPAVAERKRKERLVRLSRRGRAATILTSADDDALGTPNISRPGLRGTTSTLG